MKLKHKGSATFFDEVFLSSEDVVPKDHSALHKGVNGGLVPEVTRRMALSPSGWRRGRILSTRLILVPCIIMLVVTGQHSLDHNSWSSSVMAGVGLLMVLTGVWGRIWCTLYIGGRKDKYLITAGPYAQCRNPLYFFSWLGATGIALSSGIFSIALFILVAFPLAYLLVIESEEKKLGALHGKVFADYCAEVPRFWPLWRWKQNSDQGSLEFSPGLFHKTSRDVVWFVVAWIAVTGINLLHQMELLPVWWRLF